MPQNQAANNFATTLSAALFGSATLGAALVEGTPYTSLTTTAVTDGPVAVSDTLTLAEASAITLAEGAALATTLSVALAEGTAYTSLSLAAAPYVTQNTTVTLQDQPATLNAALSTGAAITSITTTALAGALGVGAILTLASGANTQQIVVSTAAAVAATTVAVYSFTPNFAYPVGSTITVTQTVTTSAAAVASPLPVVSFTALYAFSTASTVTAAAATTATTQGVTYTSLLVGALSGALGSGATVTLPNGESTTTSAGGASAATVVAVNAVQAKGSYASGAAVAVSQVVAVSTAAAAGVTTVDITSATALWSYTTASTITAATSAIGLTSVTGAPAYPYLLSLTHAGASGPPYAALEIVQVTASGVCTRGVEGVIAAWASGDNAGNNFTAGNFSTLVQAGWPLDHTKNMWEFRALWSSGGSAGSGNLNSGYGPDPATGTRIQTGTTTGSNVDGYLGLPSNIVASMSGATSNGVAVDLWVAINRLQAPGDQVQICLGADVTGASAIPNKALLLEVTYNGGATFYFGPTNSQAVANNLNDGNFHRIQMWMAPTASYLYIDGALAATIAVAGVTLAGGYAGTRPVGAGATNGDGSTTNINLYTAWSRILVSWPL